LQRKAYGALGFWKALDEVFPGTRHQRSAEWQGEYGHWQKRDLSARRYLYVWADGVFLQARMEDHSEWMLVLIGATPEGKKELIGFQVGVSGKRAELARTSHRAGCIRLRTC
jgi:transposase-like protein